MVGGVVTTLNANVYTLATYTDPYFGTQRWDVVTAKWYDENNLNDPSRSGSMRVAERFQTHGARRTMSIGGHRSRPVADLSLGKGAAQSPELSRIAYHAYSSRATTHAAVSIAPTVSAARCLDIHQARLKVFARSSNSPCAP